MNTQKIGFLWRKKKNINLFHLKKGPHLELFFSLLVTWIIGKSAEICVQPSQQIEMNIFV